MRSMSWLAPLSMLVAVAACGGGTGESGGSGAEAGRADRSGGDGANAAASSELYALRNRAKLEADRDSDEGFRAAATHLEALLVKAPNGPEDRLNLARVLLFTERASEVAAHLEKARTAFGAEVPADLEYVAGLAAVRAQDWETALLHFARATELRPDQIHCWYQRGYAEERLQRYEEAAASYGRSLELGPRNRAAAYRRVIVLRQLGRTAESEEAFARFQALPEDAQPDPEKCDLTEVTLVPLARRQAEPPTSELTWTDLSETHGGAFAGLRVAHDWTGPNDLDVEIAFLDDSGVSIARIPHGGTLVGRNVLPAGTGRGAADLVVGDIDNDGLADLLLLGAERVDLWLARESGNFQPMPTALPFAAALQRAELWDLDHDGDLDVVGLAAGARRTDPLAGPFVWLRNNGDRTFAPPASVTLEPAPGEADGARPDEAILRARIATLDATDFALHDLDQGNDLDVVVTGPRGTVALLNLRNGTFRPVLLEELGALERIRIEDLDNDGAPDLFGVGEGASGAGTAFVTARSAARGPRLASYRLAGVLRGSLPAPCRDLLLDDADNDGDLDVLWAGGTGLGVLRNEEGGTFVPGPGFAVAESAEATTVAVTDTDGDGHLEVWLGTSLGSRVLEAGNALDYGAWRIRPKGARDNRDAVGLVVQQYAGTEFQSRMLRGPRGLRLGLAAHAPGEVDGLRLRWPQGIVQSEARDEIVLNGPREFRPTQDEGLVASCPFLYGEGPEGWRFLTDVVGIAPLDEWLPPGAAPHLDPEEYVRIAGDALIVRDGTVRLAITEELRETTYLDRVALIVVDHPGDRTVLLDESSRQGAYDPLRLEVVRTAELQAPLAVRVLGAGAAGVSAEFAADPAGAVPELVAAVDGRYLHAYTPTLPQWSGWVDRHAIELVAPPGAAALHLIGRIGWYDSSISYALAQHGRTWGPLRLEEDGAVIVPDLGVPAGMDRTMVASFGAPRPEARTLVLSGHHRFLWDRIAFSPAPETVTLEDGEGTAQLAEGETLVARKIPAARADLGWHGFSPMHGNRALHEQTYDYTAARPEDAYEPAWGRATRYGDVLPLLAAHDDATAVLVAGDEVELDFAVPPAASAGMARTYFLRVSGWAKEGSFHNVTGRWIEPLPYRGMTSYPPSAPRPSDPAYADYLETYQTRVVRAE